jgi:hypothetical protein
VFVLLKEDSAHEFSNCVHARILLMNLANVCMLVARKIAGKLAATEAGIQDQSKTTQAYHPICYGSIMATLLYGSIMQRMKELALAGAVACSAGDRSDGSLALRCGRPWP